MHSHALTRSGDILRLKLYLLGTSVGVAYVRSIDRTSLSFGYVKFPPLYQGSSMLVLKDKKSAEKPLR